MVTEHRFAGTGPGLRWLLIVLGVVVFTDGLPAQSPRVTNGLQVLYTFDQGAGETVKDRTVGGESLDLKIRGNIETIRRVDHLMISATTRIESNGPAKRVSSAIRKSGELSVEAWIRPGSVKQSGPARIVSISKDPYQRNFTLGQQGTTLDVRLRSTKTTVNGLPSLPTPQGSISGQRMHVTYTRDPSGAARIYVDGKSVASNTTPGQLSNWEKSYRLVLGNELTGDRPWLGELHLVAIYDRALSADEVARNYQAGLPSAKTAIELGIMVATPPSSSQRVTRANWLLPPWNRWSLRNTQRLFPTDVIESAKSARFDLPYDLPPEILDDTIFTTTGGVEMRLDQWLADSYTDGILVLENGKNIYERYLNDLSPDQPHFLGSITKSMLGSLAGIYVAKGMLDTGSPVTHYLPELEGSSYEGATIRQLLDMTTGTRFTEEMEEQESELRQKAAVSGWFPGPPQPYNDLFAFLGDRKCSSRHGERFEFRSCEADVLGWVLQRVARGPVAESISERIWQPLGAEFDAHMMLSDAGHAFWDAGMAATLRDLGRFGMLHLKNGFGNGNQVLPFDWSRRILADASPGPLPDKYRRTGMVAYRNHFWISDTDRGVLVARGEYGQLLYIDRQANVVIARLASEPQARNSARQVEAMRACQAIIKALD